MSSKDRDLRNQIINFWKPKSGEYATIDTQFTPFPNHRIAAISISGDSMHVLQVKSSGEMNQLLTVTPVAIKFLYPVSFSIRKRSRGLSAVLVVLIILVISSIYLLTKRKNKFSMSPSVCFKEGDFYITIYIDGAAHKRILSSNSLLLVGLLKDSEQGVQIPLKMLVEKYQEMSKLDNFSSRTVLYRSLQEINDVFLVASSNLLIEKTKDQKDRRLILLRLNYPIKDY